MICYLTFFKSILVFVTIIGILVAKIRDLDLGWLKVIQSSWCQSVVHGLFPIPFPLTQSLYLSPFYNISRTTLITLKDASSRSSRIKVHRANRKPIWRWTGTVQGHLRSKVMVPIGSLCVVSYLTSIVSNIVSLRVFEISGVKRLWPGSRTVQDHPISQVMVPIDSPWMTAYLTSIGPHHRICRLFCNIWSAILMTLYYNSSSSSKVKVRGANRKLIGCFLCDLHCVQHCICHSIRDICDLDIW